MRGNKSRTTDQMMDLKPEGKGKGNGQLSLDLDLPDFSVEEAQFLTLTNSETTENIWYCRSITKNCDLQGVSKVFAFLIPEP